MTSAPRAYERTSTVLAASDRRPRGGSGAAVHGDGHHWSDRFPWIVEAARKIRQKRFVLDGEGVILGGLLP